MTQSLIVLERCPRCDAQLALRRSRSSDKPPFIGCRRWPDCNFTEQFDKRQQRLLERIVELEDLVDELLDERIAKTKAPAPLDVARELRALAAAVHPDRHGGSRVAHELTVAVLALRDRLRKRA